MKGKVIKNIADKFTIVSEDDVIFENCKARGNLKQNGKILVGDNVEYSIELGEAVIEKIDSRINEFIRPPIANLQIMLIVISEKPAVDLLLLDKLILNCKIKNVKPIIVINKEDIIKASFIENIKEIYKDSGVDILVVSAVTGNGKEDLVDAIQGKIACLSGQSAVGKSSIINMLLDKNEKVGELSKKIERGKNTTRHAEIHFIKEQNIYLADTAGFSKFDALDIAYNKIEEFMQEFDEFRCDCHYKPCSHIFEKEQDCAVKSALNDCKINKNRYNNYKQIYEQIKNAWESRYE